MNWSLRTKVSERLNLIQLGLVQNFWASKWWSFTLSRSLLIQICAKWESILKEKSNFTSTLLLSLRNERWPQVSKIIAVWCCLNKQRIWRKNCGNQGNSFPKQHLRFQRFLWGYINPHMDYIILDILLKVVNYNIHEKFSLWRYSFHGMLLHTPTCISLTRSSKVGGRTWIREIVVLPSSSFGHEVKSLSLQLYTSN